MKRGGVLFPLVLVCAGLLVYSNSFEVSFLFDDQYFILQNPSIRHLWPLWNFLVSPSNFEPGAHRPTVQFSLALNFAWGGLNVWGYHAVNVAIHLLVALLLFGIVRRTLEGRSLRAQYGSTSEWLALIIVLLWVVHPLHTECVTYIYQRAESLMGLFYLATLYCVMRGAPSARRRVWNAAAVIACAAGMGGKQTMVTSPLAVLLYDRVFLSGSIREALRERGKLYLGLAATWGIPVTLLATAHNEIPSMAGFTYKEITPIGYALTQPGVILHYLRLAFWPRPLVFDYQWPIARGAGAVVPPLLIVGGLLLATLWALRRRRAAGFLGGWFFLILAPTSSFIQNSQVAVEYRMYLPLAAVVTLVVLTGHKLLGTLLPSRTRLRRWVAAGLTVVGVAALGTTTFWRNKDYRSALSLWGDTAAKRPKNHLARNNFGVALSESGKFQEAVVEFQEALRLKPDFVKTHCNLGIVLMQLGKDEEAISHYAQAIELKPDYGEAYYNWGVALIKRDRWEEAATLLREAARLEPDSVEPHNNFGIALEKIGRVEEALLQFQEALRLEPNSLQARMNVAAALARQGKHGQAIEQYRMALSHAPNDPAIRHKLEEVLRGLQNRREVTP